MISRIGINKKFGFTLIEVLLVLVILGVIAGLSIPNLSQTYSTILLNQTASDIAYLMRYAQSRAVLGRQALRLVLDPQTKQYSLKQEDSTITENEPSFRFRPILGRLGRTFTIPPEIQVTTENPTVDFQPDGNIQKISWSLCRKKKCLTISTKEQIGYVQIFEEEDKD